MWSITDVATLRKVGKKLIEEKCPLTEKNLSALGHLTGKYSLSQIRTRISYERTLFKKKEKGIANRLDTYFYNYLNAMVIFRLLYLFV